MKKNEIRNLKLSSAAVVIGALGVDVILFFLISDRDLPDVANRYSPY